MTTAPEIPAQIATSDLCRSVPFELVRDEGDPGDGLTFRGYAAVFDEVTTVDSWEGRFTEQIAAGAFKKSLRERTPVLQFDHGTHPMVGSLPLGKITQASEDDRGVLVEARLADNWLVQPVRDAIASGAVDGMSFRFEVVRDRWQTPDGKTLTDPDEILKRIYGPSEDGLLLRTLLELKSREMGPVVFPQYTGTSSTVRSVTFDLSRPLDAEQQRELAHVVYAAEAATQDSPESPDGTDQAADHETGETEPPQATVTAGEHGSDDAEPEGLRDAIQRWRALKAPTIRHALEGAPSYE